MLSPKQLGLLAGFIKIAIELYPNKPAEYAEDAEDVEGVEDESGPMEPWEKCLKSLVDQENALPNYGTVQNDPGLDFLVTYYES